MSVYSGKDELVKEIFSGNENNFFVDVGACDGVNGSHTYTLEKDCGYNQLLT